MARTVRAPRTKVKRPNVPQPNANVQQLLDMRAANGGQMGNADALNRYQAPTLGPVPMRSGGYSLGTLSGLSSGGGSGWQSSLSPAERDLWMRESSLNPLADNPTSTAFGIWQGLQSTRNAYGRKVGVDPNTTDPLQQLLMGRAYIRDRYGTAENALRFWQQHHWY